MTLAICSNVMGFSGASSQEFDPSAEPQVVIYMPEISKTHLGGTMRLGTHACTRCCRSRVETLCANNGH